MAVWIILLAIPVVSLAQSTTTEHGPHAQFGEADSDVKQLMDQLQKASEGRDAARYAVNFSEDASWEGPHGENAAGPDNIRRSIELVFRATGPLQLSQWAVRTISPTVVLVDLHQRAEGLKGDANASTALGSILSIGNVRTTLLLAERNGQWRVTFGRVAFLRGGNVTSAAR